MSFTEKPFPFSSFIYLVGLKKGTGFQYSYLINMLYLRDLSSVTRHFFIISIFRVFSFSGIGYALSHISGLILCPVIVPFLSPSSGRSLLL